MERQRTTRLAGVGNLHEYRTADGTRLSVVEFRSGRRQLLVDDPSDPDRRRVVADLDRQDSSLLAHLLTWTSSRAGHVR